MLHIDKKVILFISLLLLGIIMAMQGKSILNVNRQKTSAAYRIADYKDQLLLEQEKAKRLKTLILENEKKKEALLKDLAKSDKNDYKKILGQNLDQGKLIAGLTDVKGKGIVITLNDALVRESENPNDLIIHQSDVYEVVNELKFAGAQAISINGERLIASSEQVCAGPTIKINKNRYAVPYEITAIGDPDLLYQVVDESGIISGLRADKIRVEINKSNDITIPKYHDAIEKLIIGLEVLEQ